jgi:hypothetical protein
MSENDVRSELSMPLKNYRKVNRGDCFDDQKTVMNDDAQSNYTYVPPMAPERPAEHSVSDFVSDVSRGIQPANYRNTRNHFDDQATVRPENPPSEGSSVLGPNAPAREVEHSVSGYNVPMRS